MRGYGAVDGILGGLQDRYVRLLVTIAPAATFAATVAAGTARATSLQRGGLLIACEVAPDGGDRVAEEHACARGEPE